MPDGMNPPSRQQVSAMFTCTALKSQTWPDPAASLPFAFFEISPFLSVDRAVCSKAAAAKHSVAFNCSNYGDCERFFGGNCVSV